MKYQRLQDQSNLHWYKFNDGKKMQMNKLAPLIEKLFNHERLTVKEVSEKIGMEREIVTHVIRRLCVQSILTRQCGGKNKQTVYYKEPTCLIANLYHPKSSIKFKVLGRKVIKVEDGVNVSYPLSINNHKNSFMIYELGNG